MSNSKYYSAKRRAKYIAGCITGQTLEIAEARAIVAQLIAQIDQGSKLPAECLCMGFGPHDQYEQEN